MNARSISPDVIGDAGRRLFGQQWQAPFAHALGISHRKLRYWLSGDEQPHHDEVLRMIALLEHSSVESSRIADYLRDRLDRPTLLGGWKFDVDELRIVDRHTVEHIPTSTRITFYEYVDEPKDFIPGGTFSNTHLWSPQEMAQLQTAAWKVMARHRYG